MTDKPFASLIRFRLSTLLLAMFVIATLSAVFLRPKSRLRTFGDTLVIESDLAESPQLAGVLLDHGPWHLRTRAGTPLVDGVHEYGTPTGTWRFYDAQGQVYEEGQVKDSQFVGRWKQTSADGTITTEVDFSPTPTATSATNPRSSAGITPVSEEDRMRWRTMLAADSFPQRSLAIHEMAERGPAVLPDLLSVVEDRSHPLRMTALHLIKRFGAGNPDAIERLSRALKQANVADATQLLAALVVIDGEQRTQHVHRLLEMAALEHHIGVEDVYAVLENRFGFFIASLSEGIRDGRPEVRRLTASLLAIGLDRHTVCCDERESSANGDLDVFDLGPACRFREYHEPDLNEKEARIRCDEIVLMLKTMVQDSDEETRTLADKPWRLWQNRSIKP